MINIKNILNSKQRLILISIFVLSLSLRILLTIGVYEENGTSDWRDAKYYVSIGESFAEGNFYPTNSKTYSYMVVGPVVPLTVAVSKILTNDPIVPILILNCILGALLVFVLFELGKELVSITAGYVMSIWSVFNPGLIRINYQILKEPIIILVIPLIIMLLVKIYKDKNALLNTIYSSLLFSLLIHTDERFVVFGPLFLIFIAVITIKKLKLFRALLWVFVLIVTMIPWTVRNYVQHGEFVILTPRMTTLTSKFWGTDLVKLDYSSEEDMAKLVNLHLKSAQEAELKYGKAPRAFGKRERYFRVFVNYWQPAYLRLTYVHSGYEPVKWSIAHNATSIIFFGVYLPFYLLGIIYALYKKNYLISFIGIIPIYYSVFHAMMLIWPLERYRLPFNFIVVLVAIWLIKELLSRFMPKWSNPDTQLIKNQTTNKSDFKTVHNISS
ncbi:MAG: hypothetical protein PHY48_02660 [Candidatus Cloacimonetes bacterium]|nr:hypothetical protein [Candidatus Cloacimonadota bacterium]